MKVFIFATLCEAKSTLEKAEKTNDPALFHHPRGKIVISGIGTYASMMATTKYGQDADEIINLGFAASLKDCPIGTISDCTMVGKYAPFEGDVKSATFMEKVIPILKWENGNNRLLSVDFPIHSEKLREPLKEKWDFIDMEGYGVAFAALALNKRCRLVKIVSDFAKCGGRSLIEQHQQNLSRQLYESCFY